MVSTTTTTLPLTPSFLPLHTLLSPSSPLISPIISLSSLSFPFVPSPFSSTPLPFVILSLFTLDTLSFHPSLSLLVHLPFHYHSFIHLYLISYVCCCLSVPLPLLFHHSFIHSLIPCIPLSFLSHSLSLLTYILTTSLTTHTSTILPSLPLLFRTSIAAAYLPYLLSLSLPFPSLPYYTYPTCCRLIKDDEGHERTW